MLSDFILTSFLLKWHRYSLFGELVLNKIILIGVTLCCDLRLSVMLSIGSSGKPDKTTLNNLLSFSGCE